MKIRTVFLVCVISLCSAFSWGQTTWPLTSTMTATLNSGILTITTTANSEKMPDVDYNDYKYPLWYSVTKSIHTVVIGDKITTIGMYAFIDCGLTSITIPNSVTAIGQGAFTRCNNLESLVIPNSVITLGNWAFNQCTGLKSATVNWVTPLSVNTSAGMFQSVDLSAATLYVPIGTRALYQAANVWKDFGTIVEGTPTGVEQVEVQTLKANVSNGMLHISGLRTGESLSIYNATGQLVYQGIAKAAEEYVPLAASGVYIVVAGEQTVKTIMN